MHTRLLLYPLLLTPTLHTRVWGGRKLATIFDKPLPTSDPYGESWELHDSAVVANGSLTGWTVGALLKEYGAALVGKGNDALLGFPLLVKFLDAQDWLSVQVHPDDLQAARLEGEPRGKTEAWIILQNDPGAQIIIGVEPGTTREAMAQAIRDNTLESLLIAAEAHTGDVLYLRANTIHALGPGLMIYEIQQSSDVTYRLYDWGRMGLDGKPRDLHIEKGVQVSNVDAIPHITHPGSDDAPVTFMVQGEFFSTVRYRLDDSLRPAPELDTRNKRFHALTCTRGNAGVDWNGHTLDFVSGQTILIPANAGEYRLVGKGEILLSWQGD